jgi:hypothetical protein
VGRILVSIIEGHSHSLQVTEVRRVADWISKFKVFSRNVGLLIYNLKFSSCSSFRVVFNLFNEKNQAKVAATRDHTPDFPWFTDSMKNGKHSYVQVAKTNIFPLTGVNKVPLRSSAVTQPLNHERHRFSQD